MSRLSRFRAQVRDCGYCRHNDPACDCDWLDEMSEEALDDIEADLSEQDYEDRMDRIEWERDSMPWWYDGR